jgi:cullin 3
MTVAAAKVENAEERKDTMEKVEESRKHQTEAAIVRIMKYLPRYNHSDKDNAKHWITII